MALYWPSLAIPQKLHAQCAAVAEAIRNTANLANPHIISLSDLLRRTFRKQRSSTPLLQFGDGLAEETATAETPPWDGYDECGATGLEMASHVIELHSAAAKCLDAADYALARLRTELAAVTPGLLGEETNRAPLVSSRLRHPKSASQYVRQRSTKHGGLAAA